ncbi:MAG: hypothetical protein V2B18_12260, partial [Pseudomonadota bacterium]
MGATPLSRVFIGALLLTVLPTVAFGQSWYYPTAFGITAEPTLQLGYQFSKDTGMLLQTRGVATATNNFAGVFGLQRIKLDFPTQGVWGEVTVPIRFPGRLSLFAGVGHLFSFDQIASEVYNNGQGNNGQEANEWITGLDVWNLNLAATYDVYPGVAAIGGFRLDSFSVALREPWGGLVRPTAPAGLPIQMDTANEADFNVIQYTPYIGFVAGASSPSATARIGAIGFPLMLGYWDYRQSFFSAQLRGRALGFGNAVDANSAAIGKAQAVWSNSFDAGYFLEVFCEATSRLWDMVEM